MSGKRASSDLFDLVRAMTPSEKRHFRLSSARGDKEANRYLRLFAALEQQEQYDDEALRRKLRLTDKARFSRLKNYLYRALLESLEAYYRDQTVDARFLHAMNRAQILLNKRLYRQASKLLRQAAKLAAEKGNGTYALMVETLDLSRLAQEEAFRDLEQRLDDYPALRAEQLQRAGDFADLQMIKGKATWLLRHGDRDRERRQAWLEELREHRLLAQNPYPEDVEFTLYHYNLNGLVHSLLGEREADFGYRVAYLDTYQANPEYIHRWPQNYIVALGNVAGACGERGEYDRLLACTAEMRAFTEREGIKNVASLQPLIDVRSHGFELEAWPALDLKARRALNERLEALHERYADEVTEIWRQVLRFGIARWHACHGRPERAQDWLGLILQESDEKIYPALQGAARVLDAVVHHRLGHARYLEGHLPKLRSWLQRQDQLGPALDAWIRALRDHLFRDRNPWPAGAWQAVVEEAASPEGAHPEAYRELLRQLQPAAVQASAAAPSREGAPRA
jgi:hypothetical protein